MHKGSTVDYMARKEATSFQASFENILLNFSLYRLGLYIYFFFLVIWEYVLLFVRFCIRVCLDGDSVLEVGAIGRSRFKLSLNS